MSITRLWRGWTLPENADAYERFLLEELFPSMRDIPGFMGADILRRVEGAEVAFVTVVRFTTIEDVRRFAGHSIDVPVIEPRAAELLARFDDYAAHYKTAEYRP
jgi:antibiotic biosynthesis monooxygenase (ABM) superfamily enzyme